MNNDLQFTPQAAKKGEDLGYAPHLLPLLFLVPFVQVAWAEGFVQAAEQKAILRFAAGLGIRPGHQAFEKLLEWFDERPTDEFFVGSIEDLRQLLAEIPAGEAARLRSLLQSGCVETARAAGDIGLRRERSSIRREELEILSFIGDRLDLSATHA